MRKIKHVLHKVSMLFGLMPSSTQQLTNLLREVERKTAVLDQDTLSMIEGTIEVSTKQVRDIMVPRAQMIVIHHNQSLESFLPNIIAAKHSRYPVIRENRDEVMGLLLAKDLISYLADPSPPSFNMDDFLHPMTFIPESKRLDNLLKSFQLQHNHMAIVVNEYGGVSGLITIEDIIEQIVGEIEDEHYVSPNEQIKKSGDHQYIIQGSTTLSDINETLNIKLDTQYYDTIGGLVTQYFGYLPQTTEHTTHDGIIFKVLHADKKRIQSVELTLPHKTP